MISIEHLTVEFGAKPLFTDISYVINRHDRIALVGKNGAGKSTMLRIIAGMLTPTSGRVGRPKDLQIGYLPQVMKLSDELTVREEARLAFAASLSVNDRIDELSRQLSERTDYESQDYANLISTISDLTEQASAMQPERRDAELERTLMGLGFEHSDLDRPTAEFSGGWRMRIELAKILLGHPDVLLLDEPTNHLDIESIGWLERFLATSGTTIVLISHDRAFLDRVTTRTIEITCGTIHDYQVNYSRYVTLRQERVQQQMRAYQNQQKMLQETRDFIERFRYQATKAVQVQSRIKQLAKVQLIEVDEVDASHLNIKFPPAPRSGDYPLICQDVAKAYDHVVFSHVNLTIKRGEKVAFVGRNGEGKSTLVRCIMGQIPYEGNLKLGYGVKIGYFAQNQAQLLDEKLSVFDTIDRVAVGDIRTRIKDILGAFMFRGEDIDKPVGVLSGGERSRLAMIRLLLEPVNLLILDEPTNHLDIPSKQVLKDAISAFEGTAIIVSHDRDFLDGLVTRVYEFGHGQVREHLGGIYDYLQAKSAELQTPVAKLSQRQGGTKEQSTGNASANASGQSGATTAAKGATDYALLRSSRAHRSSLKKSIEQCETQLHDIEQQIGQIEALMSTPEGASDTSLYTKHAALKKRYADVEDQWLTLSEELDALS